MRIVSERPTAAIRVPDARPLPRLPGLEVDMQYRRRRVGGDFFDIFPAGEDHLFFILLDIAGKAEQALPISASIQTMVRAELPPLFDREANPNEQLSDIAIRINRTIIAEAGGIKNSPAFLGLYNRRLGLLSYCNAGHIPGLLGDREDVVRLSGGGIPLGLFGHYGPEIHMVAMQPDSVLLLASKGIVTARCGREEFGIDRLASFVAAHSFPSARHWCIEILNEVERFQRQATHFGPQFTFFGMGTRGTGQDSTVVAIVRRLETMIRAA